MFKNLFYILVLGLFALSVTACMGNDEEGNVEDLQTQIADLEAENQYLVNQRNETATPVAVTPVPLNTATSLPTNTPSPTATVVPLYVVYPDSETAKVSSVGNGTYYLEFNLVQNDNGQTFDQAKQDAENLMLEVRNACVETVDGSMRYPAIVRQYGEVVIASYDGGKLTEACLLKIQNVFSIAVDSTGKIPQDAIEELKEFDRIGRPFSDTGENDHLNGPKRTIAIDTRSRTFVGTWGGDIWPYLDTACFGEALSFLGSEPSDVIFVDREQVWNILWKYDMTNWPGDNQYGGNIPDFCESESLIEVPKPDWALSLKYDSDETFISFENERGAKTAFSLHTDPASCNLFPNQWTEGRFLVEIVIENENPTMTQREAFASLFPGDLILLEHTWDDWSKNVYLTVDMAGQLHWYQPLGKGPSEYSTRVATLSVNPMVDGISNWWRYLLDWPASPYVIRDENGEIISTVTQTVAIPFED